MQSCLICDDHALVLEALAGAIGTRWPNAAITRSANFPDAWALATLAPELIIADLVMPGSDERGGIAGLRRSAPDTPIIILTGSHDDLILIDLLAAGVNGFIQKTSGAEVILAAIELVMAGGRYLPPRLAELVAGGRPVAAPSNTERSLVTQRQKEVLRLIADGLSNKEIARALGVAPTTVKTHVAQAIASVGALNRTDAAIKAISTGLI